VLAVLGDKPIEPKRVEMITINHRKKLLKHLLQRERQEFGNHAGAEGGEVPIADGAEITYVVEDVWGNRSAFNEYRAIFKGLTLTRFNRSKPALPCVASTLLPFYCGSCVPHCACSHSLSIFFFFFFLFFLGGLPFAQCLAGVGVAAACRSVSWSLVFFSRLQVSFNAALTDSRSLCLSSQLEW
jgi:hypothetical protein